MIWQKEREYKQLVCPMLLGSLLLLSERTALFHYDFKHLKASVDVTASVNAGV